jgi:pimeloyl-ACP methyl ester carboxylesterase
MKFLWVLLSLVLSLSSFGQAYDSVFSRAINLVNQKNYPAALVCFKMAFADTLPPGPYDLYYGASAAIQCNERELAFQWLNLAQRKGLGLGMGEILLVERDTALDRLHADPRWPVFLNTLQRAAEEKAKADKKAADDWMSTIHKNRIKGMKGGTYRTAPPGFALYFSRADTIDIPWLVYVPGSYRSETPSKAIVFLHGAVNSHPYFRNEDPHIRNETIFSIADSLQSLIIYPFARSSFGWVNQKAAFEQVLHTVKEAMHIYHIDDKQVYMAGLSNGGTACFWFAAQPSSPFKAFLALSALPKLNIGEIDFARIGPDRPLTSVHARDDDQFPYETVAGIYAAEGSKAKGWTFQTLESGGHVFIYGANGKTLLLNYMRELMK